MIHHGDCLDVMRTMPDASVDAIVTDPPYGIGFMGQAWDAQSIGRAAAHDAETRKSVGPHSASRPGRAKARSSSAFGSAAHYAGPVRGGTEWQEWCYAWAVEALRVAKPGAYLLAFGGTRTSHRLACAIEDAGWIIRDTLCWIYASGFPKGRANLKPAFEPIVMARKPGALRPLNIDACRIGTEPVTSLKGLGQNVNLNDDGWKGIGHRPAPTVSTGRWPANVILTDPIFDGGVEGVVGGGQTTTATFSGPSARVRNNGLGLGTSDLRNGESSAPDQYGDTGTYSRFFLIPKASRSDREPVVRGQLEEGTLRTMSGGQNVGPGRTEAQGYAHGRTNLHPTVKPVELMRHLVRLVTPPGGTVLDPFAGSGSTLIAAEQEGFTWIGIEKEAEYVAIAEARLNGTQRGFGLEVPA